MLDFLIIKENYLKSEAEYLKKEISFLQKSLDFFAERTRKSNVLSTIKIKLQTLEYELPEITKAKDRKHVQKQIAYWQKVEEQKVQDYEQFVTQTQAKAKKNDFYLKWWVETSGDIVAKIKELEDKVQQLNAVITNTLESNNNITKQIAKLEEEINVWEQQLQNNNNLLLYKQEEKQLTQQHKDLLKNIKQIEAEINSSEIIINNLKDKIKQAHADEIALNSDLEQQNQEIKIAEKIDALEKAVKVYIAQENEILAKTKSIIEETKKIEQEKFKLEKNLIKQEKIIQNKSLKTKPSFLKRFLGFLSCGFYNPVQNLKNQIKKEIAEIQKDMQNTSALIEKKLSTIKNKDEYRHEILKTERRPIADKIVEIQKQILSLKKQFNHEGNFYNRKKELTKKIKKINTSKEAISVQKVELTSQLDSEISQINQLQDKLSTKNSQIKLTIENLSKKAAEKTKLEKFQLEFKQNTELFERKRKELANLKEYQEKNEKKIQQEQQKVAAEKNEKIEILENLKQKFDQIGNEFSKKTKIDFTKQESITKQISKSQNKLKEVNQEIKELKMKLFFNVTVEDIEQEQKPLILIKDNEKLQSENKVSDCELPITMCLSC